MITIQLQLMADGTVRMPLQDILLVQGWSKSANAELSIVARRLPPGLMPEWFDGVEAWEGVEAEDRPALVGETP